MFKLSVIVISYNEKEYLERAIDSCLKQTFKDFEIIIGDDGSSDGSIDLIKSFDQKVKFFVMNREDGVIIPSIRISNIIKKAIDISNGEYIVILSGDDYFNDENKFFDSISFLDSNPDYFAFVSGYKEVTDDSVLRNIYPILLDPCFFWSRYYLHISCFVFRSLDKTFFLERFCDDTGLIFSIMRAGKWKYSNKITFSYYQRNHSIMHESKKIELAVIELMIFQDILNIDSIEKKFYFASLSKYFSAYFKVFTHKKELKNEYLDKYINSCKSFDHDLIGDLRNYSSLKMSRKIYLRYLLFEMFAFRYGFLAIIYFKRLLNHIFKFIIYD